MELNELGWWSNWATTRRLSKNAYIMSSDRFREPFFNRACFVECGALPGSKENAERLFGRSGLAPLITLNRHCSSDVRRLVRWGYHTSDVMIVMTASGRGEPPGLPESEVRETTTRSAKDWTRAYLLSFYGEETLAPDVNSVVRRLLRARSATLIEARLEGATAGVLAIYRTPRLAGLYCVGTVPKFRRRGIAGRLLGRASEIADSEGRQVVLQTLRSDGAEGFYTKRGFVPLYSKNFMEREN